jgi:hypothetical protein
VRELVSLRKDTLSHAYELMKVEDPKKRRRLADQVARGELTLIKLRDKIEGRRRQPRLDEGNGTEPVIFAIEVDSAQVEDEPIEDEVVVEAPPVLTMDRPLTEDSLVNAKASLADALDELVGVLRAPETIQSIGDVDRDNLAKYLTISKLRLENAIALVRSGNGFD